jgi:hypothetical protein
MSLVALAVARARHKRSYHDEVDACMKREVLQPGPFPIYQTEVAPGCTINFCSNYDKGSTDSSVFCDAFGYAEHGATQVIALAGGRRVTLGSQRAARAMVDGFMDQLRSPPIELDCGVMDAAQHVQLVMEQRHDPLNADPYYGHTTFLGGVIATTNGKRRLSFVNCGDCKLYILRQDGSMVELTFPSQVKFNDSSGYFGPNRQRENKTEYAGSVDVEAGERLIWMTDGVHDNLDRNEDRSTDVGVINDRKLERLRSLYAGDPQGFEDRVMRYVRDNNVKPDHATLLMITVKE